MRLLLFFLIASCGGKSIEPISRGEFSFDGGDPHAQWPAASDGAVKEPLAPQGCPPGQAGEEFVACDLPGGAVPFGVDDDAIYWTTSTRVGRTTKAGRTEELAQRRAPVPDTPEKMLAIEGDRIFFADDNGAGIGAIRQVWIRSMQKSGGPFFDIASAALQPGTLATGGGTHVCWDGAKVATADEIVCASLPADPVEKMGVGRLLSLDGEFLVRGVDSEDQRVNLFTAPYRNRKGPWNGPFSIDWVSGQAALVTRFEPGEEFQLDAWFFGHFDAYRADLSLVHVRFSVNSTIREELATFPPGVSARELRIDRGAFFLSDDGKEISLFRVPFAGSPAAVGAQHRFLGPRDALTAPVFDGTHAYASFLVSARPARSALVRKEK